MRKITKQVCTAFLNSKNIKIDNSEVSVRTREDGKTIVTMYLFGNVIAQREAGRSDFSITNAGWRSNTTKERLNGLPGVRIFTQNYQFYLNGKPWNGDWVTIPGTL